MKAFRADGAKGFFIADSAKQAAIGFFNKYPAARKCDIREGDYSEGFFTLTISRNSSQYKADNVTKKMINDLPE